PDRECRSSLGSGIQNRRSYAGSWSCHTRWGRAWRKTRLHKFSAIRHRPPASPDRPRSRRTLSPHSRVQCQFQSSQSTYPQSIAFGSLRVPPGKRIITHSNIDTLKVFHKIQVIVGKILIRTGYNGG